MRLNELYDRYGVRVNAFSATALFERYEAFGFLYPDKRRALAPYMDVVLENWQKALTGTADVFRVLTVEKDAAWATVMSWRSTPGGFHSQHLVSSGVPLLSCLVMLAEQASWIHTPDIASGQNWFRPVNKYTSRVFGAAVQTIGSRVAALATWSYLALPLERLGALRGGGNCVFRCAT